MALPTGTITMSDVNVELGKSPTALISLNDADVRSLAGVASGTISMDDLRGKSAGPEFFYTTTAPFYSWRHLSRTGGRGGTATYFIRLVWNASSFFGEPGEFSQIVFGTDQSARDATTQITVETGDLSPFIYFRGDPQIVSSEFAIGRLPL